MSKSFIPAIARAVGLGQDDGENEPSLNNIDNGQQINLANAPGIQAGLASLAQALALTSLAADDVLTVMNADGIAGCATRMSAATALMAAAPSMSVEAVVAFVCAHIPQMTASEPPKAQSYESQRMAAAGLASLAPAAKSGPSISASSIYERRRQQQGK